MKHDAAFAVLFWTFVVWALIAILL